MQHILHVFALVGEPAGQRLGQRILFMLALWHHRHRSRRHLADLDDRELDDIGLRPRGALGRMRQALLAGLTSRSFLPIQMGTIYLTTDKARPDSARATFLRFERQHQVSGLYRSPPRCHWARADSPVRLWRVRQATAALGTYSRGRQRGLRFSSNYR